MIALPYEERHITTCIDVFYRAAVCVAGRAKDSVGSGGEGLIFYADELRAMGVDPLPVLRRLSGQDADIAISRRDFDFWCGLIARFCVRFGDFQTMHAYPGDPLPEDAMIHHIETRSEARFYPFADIVAGIERMAVRRSIPVDALIFHFNGAVIRDADTIHRIIRIRQGETQSFADALDLWHEHANQLISPPSAQSDDASDPDHKIPAWARGVMLPSTVLTAMLGKTRRTLYNWDSAHQAPMGLPWTPGRRADGNRVMYDLEKNWPTIAKICLRDHNRDARWLEARVRAEAERLEKEAFFEERRP